MEDRRLFRKLRGKALRFASPGHGAEDRPADEAIDIEQLRDFSSVDIDPSEIGKNKPAQLGLVADLSTFLPALDEWTAARDKQMWASLQG